MSNMTVNFNAPIHLHVESLVDPDAIQDLICGLEDLMGEMTDAFYDDGAHKEDCENESEEEENAAPAKPMGEGIPMILCFAEDMPEDFSPEDASSIAKEALSHILNFRPHKEGHNDFT